MPFPLCVGGPARCFLPLFAMPTHRKLKRIRRWLLALFYPNETWLQPKSKSPDRYRRSGWRRYSRYDLPGPAYDITFIMLCAALAVACILV